jgi:hypothetical protein
MAKLEIHSYAVDPNKYSAIYWRSMVLKRQWRDNVNPAQVLVLIPAVKVAVDPSVEQPTTNFTNAYV